jgi:hypothetical protein
VAPTVAAPFALNSILKNKALPKRKLTTSATLFTFQVYKLGTCRILPVSERNISSMLMRERPLFFAPDKSVDNCRPHNVWIVLAMKSAMNRP